MLCIRWSGSESPEGGGFANAVTQPANAMAALANAMAQLAISFIPSPNALSAQAAQWLRSRAEHCVRQLDDCAGETSDRARERSDRGRCAVTAFANVAIQLLARSPSSRAQSSGD